MKIFTSLLLLTSVACIGSQAYANETPPPPASIVTDLGAQYADSARVWQGIPGIERAPNGRLWVTWYSGGKFEGAMDNYGLAATSDDQGQTWSKPELAIQGAENQRVNDPLQWVDPKGRLWIFWQQYTGVPIGGGKFIYRYDTFATRTDNPNSPHPNWSKPFVVAEGGILFGKPIVLTSGAWVAPFFIIGTPPWRAITKGNETGTLISKDEGATWTWLGGTSVEPKLRNFSEATLAQRKDGSILMMIRTMAGLYNSLSKDEGQTWTPPAPVAGFSGPGSRACMKKLASGAWLLIYNDSMQAHQREHLTAWLSDDEGRTWPHKLLLDGRQNVSYPDAVQAPDGRIFITYDYGRVQTGQKEIFVSVIREEDIRAGKIGKDSHIQLRVNQATGYGNTTELKEKAS